MIVPDIFCFSSIYQLSMLSTLLVTQRLNQWSPMPTGCRLYLAVGKQGVSFSGEQRGKRGRLRFLFPQLLLFSKFYSFFEVGLHTTFSFSLNVADASSAFEESRTSSWTSHHPCGFPTHSLKLLKLSIVCVCVCVCACNVFLTKNLNNRVGKEMVNILAT